MTADGTSVFVASCVYEDGSISPTSHHANDTRMVVMDAATSGRSGAELSSGELLARVGEGPVDGRTATQIGAAFLAGPWQEVIKKISDPKMGVNIEADTKVAIEGLKYNSTSEGTEVRDRHDYSIIKQLLGTKLKTKEWGEVVTWEKVTGTDNVVGEFDIRGRNGSRLKILLTINQQHSSGMCCRLNNSSQHVSETKWVIGLSIGRLVRATDSVSDSDY